MDEDRRTLEIEQNSVINVKLDSLLDYNKRQDNRIGEIHKILTGNGTPESGVVVKQARISEKLTAIAGTLKTHWIMIWAILTALIGIGITSIFV